ncbi:iron ABC transporter permease [Marinobacter sp. F4206]|jgi:iron complex transport system permease protein|uniref:iron ABC transporter permease n=1 Tax=Marinobacter sp. F4206 TaxID=2861777 RepID=UPI001C5F9FD7|nr:iron ABC transporter permease [Marinobacter sp. F4206]MBW4935558.1 iron ABC transporter permease [Marinobacter sp. F4206]
MTNDATLRPAALYGAMVAFLALLFVVGLMMGSRWISPSQLLVALDGSSDLLTRITVLELRLPRNLLGLLGGAALGVAGAVMQGVTRNSLASPGLTGVIASAALAVVSLRTLSSPAAMWLPLMALGGGLLGGALTFAIAGRRQLQPERVVLAGIAVTSLATALTTGLLLVSGAEAAELYYWLAGSLMGRGWLQLQMVLPWLLLPLFALLVMQRPFRLLQLDDDLAQTMGLAVGRWRLVFLLLALLLAAALVAFTGPIVFIGLVAPHIARRIIGNQLQHWLPLSALLGGLLLLAADILARQLAFPQELPVGMLTALIGAPWLIYLLNSRISPRSA